MGKQTKFTLEINGMELPENVRSEISAALNNVLMEKLGSLDMMKAAKKGGSGNHSIIMIRPDGGKIEMLMSDALKARISEIDNVVNDKTVQELRIQM